MSALTLGMILTNFIKSGGAQKTANAISDMSANSLIEYSSAARVEPIVVVDTRLTGYDFTTDVLKTLNSRFIALYLSAGSMVSDVGRVKTVKALDKINPSRSVSFNLANNILFNAMSSGNEDIDVAPIGVVNNPMEGLAEPVNNPFANLAALPTYSAEAMVDFHYHEAPAKQAGKGKGKDGKEDNNSNTSEQPKPRYTVNSAKNATDLTTVANLSVGQLVTLNIGDGEAARDIQVSIQFTSYPTDPLTIKRILKWTEKDNRLSARLNAWRAGELDFWRDVVFMRDIYTERLQALMEDRTGLFRLMTSRMNKNMLSGILSMTPSVGTISSVMVVAEDTISEVEDELDSSFDDFRTRQNFMNRTGVQFLAVVDPISEMVKIYTYTRPKADIYSVKQLKAASKSAGGDIAEIVKLLTPAGGARNF